MEKRFAKTPDDPYVFGEKAQLESDIKMLSKNSEFASKAARDVASGKMTLATSFRFPVPDMAEAITMHERLHRLEFGARRGFGSVKVTAAIGGTQWRTSVFPSKIGEWWLLVGKKVLKAEDLVVGDTAEIALELL